MAAKADSWNGAVAKRDKKGPKPAKAAVDKTSRWTVRGVSAPLQKAAGDAARARSLTLGQWLSGLLEEATRGNAPVSASASDWTSAVEDRLAKLEAALAEAGSPGRATASGRKARRPPAEARA